MRSAVFSALISLVTIITQGFADTSQNTSIKFSSTYTDLQKDCKDKFSDVGEGQDMPVLCKGPGGYKIDVEFSACCEHMQVEGGKDYLFLFPMQIFVTVMKRKLEWRLANGKPFAVIFRIDKYNGDITMSPQKVGELLIIKGLSGFSNIDYEFDPKLHTNPNQEARRLADQGYLKRKQMKTINRVTARIS